MTLSPAALIAHKRDGGEHEPGDLHWLIESFGKGELKDYQMTAWLMAVYLRGLSDSEMVALTEAMLHSGHVQSKKAKGPPRIDKHSTGGVGDKLSLPLSAIGAACGLHVPMIAGRGLGHTGGTLDKLESIPGYNTQLSRAQFEKTIRAVGTSIIGQTPDIAPADKRIYALRDVTGTVACRPLIVASILSKKLAEGLDGLVLDVKVGRGAFMKDLGAARALARSLVKVSKGLGTPAVAQLTNMDAPLGTTIGNALEVKESILILRGEGPSDSTELTMALASEMLLLGKMANSRKEARALAEKSVREGKALRIFREMVRLHGGDVRVIDKPELLPATRLRLEVRATSSGTVQSIDALALAELALDLGAGRKRAEDRVDPAVGIELHVGVGGQVQKGDRLCTLHVRKKRAPDILSAQAAFAIKRAKLAPPALLLGRVR